MADQIEQIVTALTGCCAECADRAEHIAWAIHEHAPAGLLANREQAAAVAARALRDAQTDIKARIKVMTEAGAEETCMSALHDAWSLLNNRIRDIEREAGASDA